MPLHTAKLRVRRSDTVGLATPTDQIGVIAILAVALTLISVMMAAQARAQAPFSATTFAELAIPATTVVPRVSRVRGAAAAEPSVTDCGDGKPVSGAVASVIDGRSFLLVDGREIRLAAIETPPISVADAVQDAGEA